MITRRNQWQNSSERNGKWLVSIGWNRKKKQTKWRGAAKGHNVANNQFLASTFTHLFDHFRAHCSPKWQWRTSHHAYTIIKFRYRWKERFFRTTHTHPIACIREPFSHQLQWIGLDTKHFVITHQKVEQFLLPQRKQRRNLKR